MDSYISKVYKNKLFNFKMNNNCFKIVCQYGWNKK